MSQQTKGGVRERLRELAEEYRDLGEQIKHLKASQWRRRIEGVDALRQLGVGVVDFKLDGGKKLLRAQTYEVVKPEWDAGRLAAAMRGKTLSKRLFKLVVAEDNLEEMVKSGEIPLDTVRECVTVKKVTGFRVDVVDDPDADVPF